MALFNFVLRGFGRGVIDTEALDDLSMSGDLEVGGDAEVTGDLVVAELNGVSLPVDVNGPGTNGANILAALESLGILNDTSG
jgi:hypothetical protein